MATSSSANSAMRGSAGMREAFPEDAAASGAWAGAAIVSSKPRHAKSPARFTLFVPPRACRIAEVARAQAGLEPGDEAVDVVDWQSQVLAQRPGVGRHIGALEQHRADLGVSLEERLAGLEDIALGRRDIELRLVAENGAGELRSLVGPDHGRAGRHPGAEQVLGRERLGTDGENPHAPARREQTLDEGRLQQAR